MKIRPCLMIIALLASGLSAEAQILIEPRSTDTLWIDSIETHSGQKTILEIYFANTDTINAIDLPLTYQYPDLLIDSVSFVGSRIENKFITVIDIDSAAAICHIGAFYFDTTREEVGPGSGLFARIHINIPDEYPTRLVPFDTTRLQTGLTFVSKDDQAYVPVFKKGYVSNTYSPTLDDSVWVGDVDVIPGQGFDVTVYGYNEHPIYNIRIPLEYQSDNVVFNSMTILGTRSFHASLVDVINDDVQKKLLIMLRFDDTQLLPSGSGPLAVLRFICLTSGSTATVIVDTTEFSYSPYFFQLGELFGFMKIYPDFIPGLISIDLSTAVGDQTSPSLPSVYSLEQNHPNPFNPTTTIEFALPERSRVVMEVYNILGQQVRLLVDGILPAGYHTVAFDGLDKDGLELASGVYFYRIKTDSFSQCKKMILMK